MGSRESLSDFGVRVARESEFSECVEVFFRGQIDTAAER